jgi:hypothetical protein
MFFQNVTTVPNDSRTVARNAFFAFSFSRWGLFGSLF